MASCGTGADWAIQRLPWAGADYPSQSLQQRLQEDQLRLRLLEFEDDDAVDGSAPLIQGASQSPLPWSGSLQLKTLELESTLPEIQALEQSLQGWIGRRIEADQLRQIEQQIEAWFWQRDQVVGIHRIAAEPESGVLRLAIAPLTLAAVTVDPASAHQFNAARAIGFVTAAIPLGTALRPGKLESALLKLNDLWGVQVRGRLQSSADPDSRTLVLELADLQRQNVLLEVDNYLNRYVGTLRTWPPGAQPTTSAAANASGSTPPGGAAAKARAQLPCNSASIGPLAWMVCCSAPQPMGGATGW